MCIICSHRDRTVCSSMDIEKAKKIFKIFSTFCAACSYMEHAAICSYMVSPILYTGVVLQSTTWLIPKLSTFCAAILIFTTVIFMCMFLQVIIPFKTNGTFCLTKFSFTSWPVADFGLGFKNNFICFLHLHKTEEDIVVYMFSHISDFKITFIYFNVYLFK